MKNTVKITFWIMLTAAVVLGINAGWDKYQEFRQAELARVMTVKDKKFDPGQLTEMAAALAAKPYVPPADNLPDELKKPIPGHSFQPRKRPLVRQKTAV